MKVLMSADPIGGVWTYALDLCRGLSEYGVEVVLATLGAPLSARQQREVAALASVTLEESRYKLEWMPDPWPDVDAAGHWLVELAHRHAVDVVHLNHLTGGGLSYGAPVLSVVHSCVLSWWEHVRHADAPWYYARYRREVRASLQASDAVATITRAMARTVQRHYGPLPDVSVIHNARPPAPAWAVVKQPVVFSAGRVWDAAKNIAGVVRVARHLTWPVCIAGPQRAPDAVTDADDEVSFTDREAVQFTGMLSARELARWYGRASIYVLPARYEPFGLTVLEAAQAGCALVLGDIPSLRELWGGAAVFVPPGDDDALAVALRSLIHDGARRERLAAAARRRAAECSFDHFVREYLLAYRTLQGGHASLFEGVRDARAS